MKWGRISIEPSGYFSSVGMLNYLTGWIGDSSVESCCPRSGFLLCSQWKSSFQSNTPLTGHWVALYPKVCQFITSMIGDTTRVLYSRKNHDVSSLILSFQREIEKETESETETERKERHMHTCLLPVFPAVAPANLCDTHSGSP